MLKRVVLLYRFVHLALKRSFASAGVRCCIPFWIWLAILQKNSLNWLGVSLSAVSKPVSEFLSSIDFFPLLESVPQSCKRVSQNFLGYVYFYVGFPVCGHFWH